MISDTPEKAKARYQYWMDEIKSAEKVFKDYATRVRKILRVYKDDRSRIDDDRTGVRASHKLNILWSNIQTLQPALYSKTPAPNVSRRFLDRDPVSRVAAQILERNLINAQELCDFDYSMRRVRDDYLLAARGTSWVRFDPEIGKVPMREPVLKGDNGYKAVRGGQFVANQKVQEDEDGSFYYETDPEEQILAYGLAIDHVMWSDFLHEPVNDWTKVTWIAKRVLMKRPKLIKFFGEEIGHKVKLNKTFNGREADEFSSNEKKKANCAEVWEIWSKDERKVCWISDGWEEGPLKEEDDPLRLSSFFPAPRPMFGTLTTDSLVPVPDYALYQDQAEQIDKITDRIRLLINALRVVGLYNGESADLSTLLGEADENEMIPVANWMAFAQAGGMKGNIDWLPIDQIQLVLTGLFTARAQLKQDLYEVTGISDIIRGATAPSETATAQQIKANFGNLRLQDRQSEMSRLCNDTLQIMAEIQAEHYSPEALIEMSGIAETDEFRLDPPPPEAAQNPQLMQAHQVKQQEVQKKLMAAVELIRNDKLRTFRIDIETDATVAPDQQKEKEARIEFLTAVSPFLEKATQVGMMVPHMVPLLMKMLEFGVRGFRAGRTLEAAIEETIALAEQMQGQAQAAGAQGPPPDPQAEAMAKKLEAESQKMQAEMQRLQMEVQQDQAKHAAEMQMMQVELAAKQQEFAMRAQQMREKFQQDMLKLTEEISFRRQENELRMAELNVSVGLKSAQTRQTNNKDHLNHVNNQMKVGENLNSVREELNELKRRSQEYDKVIGALAELVGGKDTA